MSKQTVAECKTLQKPAFHSDGSGFYLAIKSGGEPSIATPNRRENAKGRRAKIGWSVA